MLPPCGRHRALAFLEPSSSYWVREIQVLGRAFRTSLADPASKAVVKNKAENIHSRPNVKRPHKPHLAIGGLRAFQHPKQAIQISINHNLTNKLIPARHSRWIPAMALASTDSTPWSPLPAPRDTRRTYGPEATVRRPVQHQPPRAHPPILQPGDRPALAPIARRSAASSSGGWTGLDT